MFDHFQAEDDRKLAVLPGQIVIGRAGIELEFGVFALCLGDALR